MPDNPCPDADPAGQPAPPVNGDGLCGANSDEGRNIEPEVLTEVSWLFGVAVTRTTAYHPHSYGLA
ncbi:hypothetical protein T01_5651 [Trichinella spiralis]|uniref:Uncharacterized protein n=1 Tax=Trichinella spiralis TaxID=6334 RepID=A0A0V1BWT6_TRISP|nr:hypothetical protein T01_5651 [Trichinella spiralis]